MVTNKHLAAIVFTDIVGFSRLASIDEAKALELIDLNRQHQKPIIKKYGSFIKEMGDGVLAKFGSAYDAVACTLEIQRTAPDLLKNKLRIGIHLGDISLENSDVFGDGVNIASRIESIAAPGSIYISESIYQAIKNLSDVKTVFVGDKKLKNIEDPVKCYEVLGTESGVTLEPSKKPVLNQIVISSILFVILAVIATIYVTKSENKPVITVLPLIQSEGDTSDLYLEKGITEELIRSLGKNTSLVVINSNTTLRYLGSINPLEQASSEITDSDYFVKGNYVRKNNIIKIDLGLSDPSNQLIWSGIYEKDEAYIPEMISNISIDISDAIDVSLSQSDQQRIKEIKNIDPETYSLYLKGMSILGTYNLGDYPEYLKGITYLEEAVDRNPADSKAWAGLAEGYVWLGHSPMGPRGAWHKAKSAAVRAIQLDSTNAEAWAALAHTKTYFEYDYKGAQIGYKKANELNPSMAFNHYHYAWHLYLLDSLDKAIEEHRIAQKLDPFFPMHTFWLGALLASQGKYMEAKTEINNALKMEPEIFLAYSVLGDVYRREGKYDSAEYAFQKAMEIEPGAKYMGYMKYCLQVGNYEKGLQILEEVKTIFPPGSFKSWILARAYAEIDSADQFFKYATYEPAIAFVPWLRKGVSSEVIINDPRYKQLMDKMNLPMPVNLNDDY